MKTRRSPEDRLLIFTGILVVVLQVVDTFLTMWALNSGDFIETNPITRSVIENTGTWILPLVKIVPTVLAVVLFYMVLKQFKRLKVIVISGMVVAAVFYSVVIGGNLAEF